MKSKGFTLIELLAVLTVLAIIALIAVPIVINLINDTKQTANKRSIDLYAKAVETALMEERLNGNKIQPGFLKSDFLDKVEYSGEKVECTVVKLYADKTIHLSGCKVGEKKVDYTYGESNITKIEPKSTDTHKGIVYLDPTNLLAKCDETNSVSTTGTKTGCMKWYIYDDSGDTYKMILDHNTTVRIKWGDVQTALNGYNWDVTPGLISAEEIIAIVGNDNYTLNSQIGYYLSLSSKRSWLYDNLSECKDEWGCTIEDNNRYTNYDGSPVGSTPYNFGYHTSSISSKNNEYFGVTYYRWKIHRTGRMQRINQETGSDSGIRPVIKISKSLVD